MDWRQPLLAHARSLGRPVYEHALGIGIDFEDGFDAFWVLPGEVTSTFAVPAEGPASVQELITEYDRIGRVRERALHVISHYLASLNVVVSAGRNGNWGLELEDGSSTSLTVGAKLTAVARDTNDVYAVVEACIKHTWLRKVPSRKRIDRYLATDGPPDTSHLAGRESERRQLIPPTIRAALGWMGLCKALDTPEVFTSPDALKAAASPTGPIAQALLRLEERLTGVDGSVDLLKPGVLSLKFDDGYDRFDIDTRSKDLARRVRADGPQGAGDALAEEFIRLNGARARVLGAVWQAAAKRGWRKQVIGMAFFGVEDSVHLGETRREVKFNPAGPLTEALRANDPGAVLRALFADAPDFADDCVAALADSRQATAGDIPDAQLLPRDAPPAPPLRQLDVDLVARLDAFAAARLRDFLREDGAIWKYRDADVYDPKLDTWATQRDWIEVAAAHLKGQWPHPMAVVILLDAGDPRADELARRYVENTEPHHEVSAAEVEIAWRYRRQYPDAARKWFLPQGFDDVPYAKERAALGDPIAARHQFAEHPEAVEVDEYTPAEVVRRLTEGQRQKVHEELLTWARTNHRWAPPDAARLRHAIAMGWRDVADELPNNPYLLATLLRIERRPDQFDEPGILLASDFLLAWSRLSPSTFLARLVATAFEADVVALAKEAARRGAVGKPDVQKNLASSASIYASWHKELQAALAIAWTRCRSAGAAGGA